MTADGESSILARTRFEAALDSTFELVPGNGIPALTLRLVEVRSQRAPATYEQYAAYFRGPSAPLLPQATYQLRHPMFGEFALFIVPIERDAAGVTYEACVARRVGGAEPSA